MSRAKQASLVDGGYQPIGPAESGPPPTSPTAVVRLSQSAGQAPSAESVLMFERLATNPDVNVEKLERLIAMQKDILAHQAKAEFDAAFAEMQGELPTIDEKGRILGNDGNLRSKYAKYEDIIRNVRPVLQKYGFAIRHRNFYLTDGRLKIVGILSHRGGHSEQDEFECPPDPSGNKNNIQAIGSTRSYGQRYTTIALLNIESRGMDDDGRAAGEQEAPAPAGFDDWWTDLIAVADNGIALLSDAWNKSKGDYKRYANAHRRDAWEELKRKASARA